MIARFGAACARWAERNLPRPFVFALLINGAVLAAGLVWWPRSGRLAGVLDAWFAGFWSRPLLAFAFQMALILITGFVVADAPAVRRALARWAVRGARHGRRSPWRPPADSC